jgi:hypothetical protein
MDPDDEADPLNRRESDSTPVGPVETIILREPWDVDPRLAELDLVRRKLFTVVAIAVGEAANATPYHCANAAGTLAYQHGTWALRNEFVGPKWTLERPNNVEAIWNESLKVRVVFCNVDVACDDERPPKPRSDKGSGAERVCVGNLFGSLPRYAPRQYAGEATYYLMADERGTAELTRPVISAGTFSSYVERIYLTDGSDLPDKISSFDNDDAVSDFDPQIVRK